MEPFINKIYKLEKSENFNEFLKKMNVNFFTRKFATSAKPKVTLVNLKDGFYSFNSSAGILKTQYKFRLGEEFTEVGMLRDQCKSVITFQGNTMVHVQRGIHHVKIVREYEAEKMIMTIYCDDQIAKRYYKAV